MSSVANVVQQVYNKNTYAGIKRGRDQVSPSLSDQLSKKQIAGSAAGLFRMISTESQKVAPTFTQCNVKVENKTSTNDKPADQLETTVTPISPTSFLKSRLLKRSKDDESSKEPHSAFFTKPTKEEMDAYDNCLVDAVRARDINALRKLHKDGRSFNASNRYGESVIHMACRRGQTDVVTFLVDEAKVRVNVRDDFGRTPFHDACWTAKPNFDLMDVLLKSVEPEMLLAEDIRGHTPFDYARKEHWNAWIDFIRKREDTLIKA